MVNDISKNSKINIALIGLGNIGLIHAEVLRESAQNDFILQAIADPKPKKKYKDLDYFTAYKELLQRKDIDAVSIATPPNSHYQITIDALSARKHVLLEKPPALTMEQLEEMTRFALKKGMVLFTAFHACYRPEVTAATQELKNKNVREIKINYKEYVLEYNDPNGWIFNPDIGGGGVLMDNGINAISIIQRILPDTEFRVVGSKLFMPSNYRVETAARVDFTFGNNGRGILQTDWLHKGDEVRQVIFRTDTDEYIVDIVQSQLLKNGTSIMERNGKKRITVDQYIEYRGIYKDFASHLMQKTSLINTKELKFILDAYQIGKGVK